MKDQPPSLNNCGEYDDHDGFSERRYGTPSESKYPHAPYFESHISTEHTYQRTEPTPNFSESRNENCHDASRATNEPRPRPYNIPSTGVASGRSPRGQPGTPFAVGNERELRRGIEKNDEVPSSNGHFPERMSADSAQQYNTVRPSFPALDGSLPSMPTPCSTYNTTEPAARDTRAVCLTTFMPFEGKFHDAESAKDFRKTQTRGGRLPYRPPHIDSSIFDLEQNRPYHVERIYNAMTRGDKARDNEKSIAMKRWVHGAYYKSHLVEAYCHKVFDCLLEQAKLGYRGWDHNDYVADDRKGEDEDRDVDCAARLDNIIRALEQEKTICEDVMNSACQIRMFVNAPRAYANRKYQNRVGNSKRGRPKDAEDDAATKPSKIRRTPLRPTTRARTSYNLQSTTSQARIFSHTPEPPQQQQPRAQQTRYLTPPTHHIASPSTLPRGTTVTRHAGIFSPEPPPSFGVDQVNPMSLPLNLTPIQLQTTMPAPQHPSIISPRSLP